MTLVRLGCCCVLLSVLLTGCGGSDRPETIPVSGSVTLDGQPLPDVVVSFWGPGASRAATGKTDSQGKYTLAMFEENDGALPGENVVTVVLDRKTPPPSSTNNMLNDPTSLASTYSSTAAGNAAKEKASVVPAKYSNRDQTPLKVTVADTEEGRNHVLQLTK